MIDDRRLAPLIAIIGADGSGKTTLAKDLAAEIARERPAEYVYLGLGSGPIGHKIAALPLIGPMFAARIEKRAGRTRDPKDKIPGTLTALVVYWFSRKRAARFEAMTQPENAYRLLLRPPPAGGTPPSVSADAAVLFNRP